MNQYLSKHNYHHCPGCKRNAPSGHLKHFRTNETFLRYFAGCISQVPCQRNFSGTLPDVCLRYLARCIYQILYLHMFLATPVAREQAQQAILIDECASLMLDGAVCFPHLVSLKTFSANTKILSCVLIFISIQWVSTIS